jgi:perosamine synthetase
MDRIMEISKRRNIPVVEDACQAHLSEWRGRKVATIGHLGCYSFQKFKNLPGGEAGAVITGDEALYRRAYGFHSHYRTPDEGPANPAGTNGINLRLAEFQASILLNQLSRLEDQAKRREENAATLTSLLKDIPGVKPARMYEGCTRNGYHLYMLRYDADAFAGLPRERFLRAVQAEGAPISAGYGQLNREPFLLNTLNSRTYRSVYSQQDIDNWRQRNQCPANDRLCADGMWIPQSALLAGRADMEDIANAIRKVKASAELLKKS